MMLLSKILITKSVMMPIMLRTRKIKRTPILKRTKKTMTLRLILTTKRVRIHYKRNFMIKKHWNTKVLIMLLKVKKRFVRSVLLIYLGLSRFMLMTVTLYLAIKPSIKMET